MIDSIIEDLFHLDVYKLFHNLENAFFHLS